MKLALAKRENLKPGAKGKVATSPPLDSKLGNQSYASLLAPSKIGSFPTKFMLAKAASSSLVSEATPPKWKEGDTTSSVQGKFHTMNQAQKAWANKQRSGLWVNWRTMEGQPHQEVESGPVSIKPGSRVAEQQSAQGLDTSGTTCVMPFHGMEEAEEVTKNMVVSHKVKGSTAKRKSEKYANMRFPRQLPYKRGNKEGLDDTAGDELACQVGQGRKLAWSTGMDRASRKRWWHQRCQSRGLEPYPLTPGKIALAAALLIKGAYRSGKLYIGAMKQQHIALGHAYPAGLAQEYRESRRAVTRGLGPARQAEELDLTGINTIPKDVWVKQGRALGPCWIKEAIVIGAWWMTREVELSAAKAEHLTFIKGEGCGGCTWLLPVSKNDHMALGKKRTHWCACPSPLCPVAAAKKLHEASSKLAMALARAENNMPLVPTTGGRHYNKQQIVNYIQHAARIAGQKETYITGHSLRCTGAMRMARAGQREEVICTFGRWESQAAKRYIREAWLHQSGLNIARSVEGIDNMVATPAVPKITKKRLLGKSSSASNEPSHGVWVAAVHKRTRVRHFMLDPCKSLCGFNFDAGNLEPCPPDMSVGRWHIPCLRRRQQIEDEVKQGA